MRPPFLAPILAAALLASAAGAQTPAFVPRPCPTEEMPDARCGTVSVPENRDAPGRMLALHVVVYPARTPAPAREAVVFFGGGPGQAIAQDARWIARELVAVRAERDLLFIDQRGTGLSAPLQCTLRDPSNPQSYLDDYLPPAAVARCRDELARTADLTRYGFVQLAHDVEAVRRALGYGKLDLDGGSYGTRAALVYLRTYPQNVRSAVLVGLVPAEFLQPADYARDSQAALTGLFAACRADARCGAAFPEVERELREVARRLDTEPGRAEIIDPQSGRRITLSISRGTFAETIRRMMYDAPTARTVPFAIHRAYQGDFRPVARTGLQIRRGMQQGSWWGLYQAIMCSEDVPFIDQAAAAAARDRTLLGDYRVRQQADACAGWPTFAVPASYHQPVPSDVPALLISGEFDPVTPPVWGRMAAAALRNSLHVVVPGAGHGYGGMQGSECMDAMITRFLHQASVAGLDTTCVARMRPPPFVIDVPEPVAVDAAVLRRLAGVYAAPQAGRELRVEALEGVLRMQMGPEFTMIASPRSETVFNWEGYPPEFSFTFSADGRTLTVREPGEPEPLVLTRTP